MGLAAGFQVQSDGIKAPDEKQLNLSLRSSFLQPGGLYTFESLHD